LYRQFLRARRRTLRFTIFVYINQFRCARFAAWNDTCRVAFISACSTPSPFAGHYRARGYAPARTAFRAADTRQHRPQDSSARASCRFGRCTTPRSAAVALPTPICSYSVRCVCHAALPPATVHARSSLPGCWTFLTLRYAHAVAICARYICGRCCYAHAVSRGRDTGYHYAPPGHLLRTPDTAEPGFRRFSWLCLLVFTRVRTLHHSGTHCYATTNDTNATHWCRFIPLRLRLDGFACTRVPLPARSWFIRGPVAVR